MFGNRHLGVELHLAGVEALEQKIKRHDLGEGGRMADAVRAGRGQRGAGIGVDNDRRKLRAVAVAILVAVTRVVMGVAVSVSVVTACLGAVRCERDRRCDREQPEHANSHQARGSPVSAKHEIPVPVSD